jgi:hypothetical protein
LSGRRHSHSGVAHQMVKDPSTQGGTPVKEQTERRQEKTHGRRDRAGGRRPPRAAPPRGDHRLGASVDCSPPRHCAARRWT